MDDCLKRAEVLQMLHNIGGCGAEKGSWADGWDEAINEAFRQAQKMPAIDAVPVVRCKDCKHYHSQTCKMDDPYDMEGDDFCSCGERRGN